MEPPRAEVIGWQWPERPAAGGTAPGAPARRIGGTRIAARGDDILVERPWFDTQPVFLSRMPGTLALSGSWPAVQEDAAIDLAYVQDYLRYQVPTTSRTFSSSVSLIRNGETWTIARDSSAHVARLPFPQPADEDLRGLLEAELDRAGPHAVFHLSSGLDSSLLVLLARRMRAGVKAASLRTRGRGASQELATVERLAQEEGIDLTIHDFTEIDLWDEGANLLRDGMPYPIAHPSHLVRYLLDRSIKADGGRTVVTGRGPDELLGGYAAHRPEFQDAAAHLVRITATPEPWIERLFLSQCASDTVMQRQSLIRQGRISLGSRLEFDLAGIFESWNVLESGLAAGLDIRYVNPFLEPRAAAFMFARPDDEKLLGAEQKRYLRSRFADIYPQHVLQTPKVGLTLDIREYLAQESVDSVVGRIYACSFGERYLRRDGVAALVEETLSGHANHGWQIWSLYLCGLAFDRLHAGARAS